MSKRRVRPRAPRGQQSAMTGQRVETRADGDWVVRPVTGSASTKPYRCPGCDHVIVPATPHTVVWPRQKSMLSESALDERRHWHTSCWQRRH
ncbi:MAG: hypothetical protein ACRDO8_09485 [Nocardioidaceae bacterium]